MTKGLVLVAAICALLAGAAAQPYAQATVAPAVTRELLNSERIAQRFGNYGIEVIETDGRVRVSSLFSEREGQRICRTFAVVQYPDRVDPAVAAEHDEIVRGGSIGAVFSAHGWNVSKTHLRFFEIGASPRVAALMRVGAGTQLAAHAYALDVRKGGRAIEYALLVEIHHPEYLGLADLRAIYGSADATGREESLEALLATAREKSGRWDIPGASDAHGGFGLPDQRGSRLLLIPALARPELLNTALCGGGRRAAVRFERRQVEGADDGRQTWRNFDTLAGSAYTVVGNTVDPDAPCFLASDALLAGSTVLSITKPAESGACLHSDRFAARRDRPVVHCWPLARLGPDKQIALLEFARRGTDVLASLALVDGARTVFADFPAEYRGVGQSLWRVDDGGVFSPDAMTIVCVLQRGDRYALGTAWAGAEGQRLSLWISEGSERFTKVIDDYWYQAPK